MIKAKDLSKEAPRSPSERLGRYYVLARMADKGRAAIRGTNGEYNFDCPLDRLFFDFKKVDAADVHTLLESGATDEQLVEWFDKNGENKRDQDIDTWNQELAAARPYENPEKRDWFVGACQPLGLDPRNTTLFELLDADDRASFPQATQA